MNQVKTRLQSLGLLDRALAATSDTELTTAYDALSDEHREALDEVVGPTDDDVPAGLRAAAVKGRLNGSLESIALVLTDSCLADCVDQLGEHADHPSTDQLREVLPGVVERHGVGITRLMLAATVAGEAPAAAIIRDLLKHDDLVGLPPAEERPSTPLAKAPQEPDPEREAIKAKRKEAKQRKQEEARARREQAARARGRG